MIKILSEIDATIAHLFSQVQMIESSFMDETGKFITIEHAMYHSLMERTVLETMKLRGQYIDKLNGHNPATIQAYLSGRQLTISDYLKGVSVPITQAEPELGFTLDNPVGRLLENDTPPPNIKRKYTKRTSVADKKETAKKNAPAAKRAIKKYRRAKK